MAGILNGIARALRGAASADPDVLELRVHGVNNTTPAALLDLPADKVRLVAGDKLGSFWEPIDPRAAAEGQRGHVPDGIVREAYSWGGMVRTTPNPGGLGAAGAIAGVGARILYALILPFSIGNAVQWTRPLVVSGGGMRRRAAVASALARLFGLVLTLLFVTTAAIVSIDVLAAQCGPDPSLCGPVAPVLQPLASWNESRRLALFALGPAAAIGALWVFSHVSRQRYDVLPRLAGTGLPHARATDAAPAPTPTAALAQPGFWSNRVTRHLARLHVAAGLALTTAFVALQAAMRGHTACVGLGGWDACIGDAWTDAGFTTLFIAAAAAGAVLLATVVVVCTLPADVSLGDDEEPSWPSAACASLLAAAIALFAFVMVVLVIFSPFGADAPPQAERGLYGSGFVPLALVCVGVLLAASGVFWRPFGDRRHEAWAGCAPAVFMTLSLVVAMGISAILVVAVGDALNGAAGAGALVHDRGAGRLHVPSSYVALGATIVTAAAVGLVLVLAAALLPRRLRERAKAWGQPADPGDVVVPLDGGVLPVSQSALLQRIEAARVLAARLHLVEPAVGVLTAVLALGALAGCVWTLAAYAQGIALAAAVPGVPLAAATGFADVSLFVLGWSGVVLTAVLASGATASAPRPLGIVWDIACYLPRTGHPFGPPSYAERAVPEIAGRLFAWLTEPGSAHRRAVLSAHSMGGVLAVSALGLLAGSPQTREVLGRISLLTFGVQLRTFFGRMLPELLGPAVLGTHPALAPRLLAADPWAADAAAQRAASGPAGTARHLEGTLLAGTPVRWVSLWRLTDFLGFTAFSTAPSGGDGGWVNGIDRFAGELDTSGYMFAIGTHGEYFRQREYDDALAELARLPR